MGFYVCCSCIAFVIERFRWFQSCKSACIALALIHGHVSRPWTDITYERSGCSIRRATETFLYLAFISGMCCFDVMCTGIAVVTLTLSAYLYTKYLDSEKLRLDALAAQKILYGESTDDEAETSGDSSGPSPKSDPSDSQDDDGAWSVDGCYRVHDVWNASPVASYSFRGTVGVHYTLIDCDHIA